MAALRHGVSTATVVFELDGRPVEAREGDTVASALLAASVLTLRRTRRRAAPRGVFCGMGVCFDCVVTVDGLRSVRACMTMVRPGMKVETQ